MILFFDTETTGLPVRGAGDDHPDQPHLVQVAACLCDEAGKLWGSLSLVIFPQSWTIPAQAARIHGITTEIAGKVGVGEDAAVMALSDLARCASTIVAHNLDFDRAIVRMALRRHEAKAVDWWNRLPGFCTMREAAAVCRIPPTPRTVAAGINGWKSPTLMEAYGHLVGTPPADGCHEAGQDMHACRAIYAALTRPKLAGEAA